MVAKSTDYCHVFKLFGVLKDTVLDQSLAEVVKTSLSLWSASLTSSTSGTIKITTSGTATWSAIIKYHILS